MFVNLGRGKSVASVAKRKKKQLRSFPTKMFGWIITKAEVLRHIEEETILFMFGA